MYISEYVEHKEHYAIVNIAIRDDFKSCVGSNLENFGQIEIRNVYTNSPNLYLNYDGINYFLENNIKTIMESLVEDGFFNKKLIKKVKKHLIYLKENGYLK